MSRSKRIAYLLLFLLTLGSAYLAWFLHLPTLVVYYEPEARHSVDWDGFLYPLREAGVRRIRLVEGLPEANELGEKEGTVSIGLVLSEERNPALDEDMIARGLTGPGYTIDWTCYVYKPDVELFLKKHQQSLRRAGAEDWAEVKRRLVTNTAVHEAWHAINQSTSHNPTDPESLMFMDPGRSPATYCLDRPLFTKGHRTRLKRRFSFQSRRFLQR